MDTARRTDSALAARGRSGPLLALALAATTALSMLAPVGAASPGPVVQVVVTAAQDGAAGVASAVRAVLAAGGTVDRELPLVGGVSATLPAGAVLPSAYVVAEDRRMQVVSESYGTAAAATVRQTLGLAAPAGEGKGVTVAVVDTGVAPVPDLKGRVTHAGVVGGKGDGYGHGTFVAGLIAGDGTSSDGVYAGVAPAAEILDVRVADDEGNSRLSLVLLGLQKVADADVDVVNLSLSSGSPMPWQIDPLTRALQSIWEDGVVVVVPSGNEAETVSSPGVHPALLTVGGLDDKATADRKDDTVATWSGRGPTDQGDLKPDLVAPGQSVISLRAPGSAADRANPDAVVDGNYFRGSGTSFSTALTSGAAALLLDERDELSPDQVKLLLSRSAYKVKDSKRTVGSGGLDVAAARAAKAPNVPQGPKAGDVPDWSPEWQALFEAFLDGDQQAVASSWSKLSKADLEWIARNWTARNWTARNWTANSWSDLDWTVTPGTTLDEWHALLWSAEMWAARNWTARNWTADDWAARNWTDEDWAARNWTARNWTARNWTARNWTANSWSARNWTARNWTARNWTARNWSAVDWAS